MEYADIYYIDPRNAMVNDHRTGGQLAGRGPRGPVQAVAVRPAPMQLQPAATVQATPVYPYPQLPPSYPPAYPAGYPVPPYVGGAPLTGNLQALVGGFGGIGSLADVVAQIFAAVLPLPNAPTPLGGEATTSMYDTNANTKNLITYQAALATYAKRDEQIRTIGSLLKKLVG